MAYSFKGAISFGLVYVPITLHAVIKPGDIGFNMLYKKTKQRIKYNRTCENCPANISTHDIIKGYEYEKGKYIIFETAEFEKIKTEKDKNIVIERFVDLKEIDPVYYEKSYYVSPNGAGAERPFVLLLKAMEAEKKAGIAKTVLGTKEAVVALRSAGGNMILNTMYFYGEVQSSPVKAAGEKVLEPELKMAKTIISGMTKKFDPALYKDEYKQRLLIAIEQKIKGEEVREVKGVKVKKVSNLMEALQLSLKQVEQKGGGLGVPL